MKLFLIRHGHVENPSNIIYGRLDGYALSPFGEKQIEGAAAFLKPHKIEKIISSPLGRTRETAALLGTHLGDLPIALDERLTERDMTHWTGINRNQFYEESSYENNPVGDAEGMEPVAAQAKRVLGVIAELEKSGKNALIVGHRDPLVAAMIVDMGLDPNSFHAIEWHPGDIYEVTLASPRHWKRVFQAPSVAGYN